MPSASVMQGAREEAGRGRLPRIMGETRKHRVSPLPSGTSPLLNFRIAEERGSVLQFPANLWAPPAPHVLSFPPVALSHPCPGQCPGRGGFKPELRALLERSGAQCHTPVTQPTADRRTAYGHLPRGHLRCGEWNHPFAPALADRGGRSHRCQPRCCHRRCRIHRARHALGTVEQSAELSDRVGGSPGSDSGGPP